MISTGFLTQQNWQNADWRYSRAAAVLQMQYLIVLIDIHLYVCPVNRILQAIKLHGNQSMSEITLITP